MARCFCGQFDLPVCVCCDTYYEDPAGHLRHTRKVCFEVENGLVKRVIEPYIKFTLFSGELKANAKGEMREDRATIGKPRVDYADAASGD